MKLVKTLALFVVLIILAAYVYFIEIEGGKEREKAKELQDMTNIEKLQENSLNLQISLNYTKG